MANGVLWRKDEVDEMVAMARNGQPFRAIADHLQRPISGVRLKFKEYARSLTPSSRKALWAERDENLQLPIAGLASAAQLADRAAREATTPSSITAALLGDPLPGRSALDLRGRA
jgi:hypothetical protein